MMSKRDELSAKYQTDKPDFCGVDTKMHEAFCAGYSARDQEVEELRTALSLLCSRVTQYAESGCIEAYSYDGDEFDGPNSLGNIVERVEALAKAKGEG
jgi:hypothetical protein